MASATPGDSAKPISTSAELRQSVDVATERIHEIIDAAERVAVEIRTDAEAEAKAYLLERRREADRLAEDRTAALDQLTRTLADSGERFKHEAERMLADLDQLISGARSGISRSGAPAPPDAEVERTPKPPEAQPQPAQPHPVAPAPKPPEAQPPPVAPAPKPPEAQPQPAAAQPVAPAAAPAPAPKTEPEPVAVAVPEPQPQPPRAAVSAYPGSLSQAPPAPPPPESTDETAEAILRATQMAITGKDREEIAAALRSDFPRVDADSIVDEILD